MKASIYTPFQTPLLTFNTNKALVLVVGVYSTILKFKNCFSLSLSLFDVFKQHPKKRVGVRERRRSRRRREHVFLQNYKSQNKLASKYTHIFKVEKQVDQAKCLVVDAATPQPTCPFYLLRHSCYKKRLI